MKKRILFISTMYPNPLRPGTPVCHFFTKEWKRMGYDIFVIHYRTMFPAIYTFAAKLFPGLAKRYVGNYVEMDRNIDIIEYEQDGIPVLSIPIFKYFPHGRHPKFVIDKKTEELQSILIKREFIPDAIIGHFYNPQMEIIAQLKQLYPNATTCVSLHETSDVIKKVLGKDVEIILNNIDVMGFRSVPIKNSFEYYFGNQHKSLLCWSGTPEVFLTTPSNYKRAFNDGPMTNYIYVGQTIKRKFPKQTVEGVHKAMGNDNFNLVFVGTQDLGYPETKDYIVTNHLEKSVTFTGKIPREEIINFYDKSDCFILISKDEVFGLVYLEAMSRGCITIAARNEGMEGIIENGINGFLCKAGDADELAEIIRSINQLSAAEKQAISERAKSKAAELSDYNVAKYYIESVIKS